MLETQTRCVSLSFERLLPIHVGMLPTRWDHVVTRRRSRSMERVSKCLGFWCGPGTKCKTTGQQL